MRRRGGSDLHIAVGLPALMRVGGALERAPGGGMEEEEVKDLLYSILTSRQQETLEKDLQPTSATPSQRSVVTAPISSYSVGVTAVFV